MVATTRTAIVGVFDDQAEARRCVAELKRIGFRDDQIGVAARGGDVQVARASDVDADDDSNAGEGAVAGALTGAGVGGLWALGIAAGALPAIGPAIAGGVLASILTSAAAAAAVGGLAGALIGLGIPEEEAREYDEQFQAGRTIVTVRSDGREDEAADLMRRFGAQVRAAHGQATSGFGRQTAMPSAVTDRMTGHTMPASTAAHEEDIELREEQLRVQKQPVESEVSIHKDVVTETKRIEVPVEREEVVIERRPATGRTMAGGMIGDDEEIRIPVREEQVNVTKDTVVTEEVRVGKRKKQDTERVEGTVRREELRIEDEGEGRTAR